MSLAGFVAQEGADAVDENHRVGRGAREPEVGRVAVQERAVQRPASGQQAARAGYFTE